MHQHQSTALLIHFKQHITTQLPIQGIESSRCDHSWSYLFILILVVILVIIIVIIVLCLGLFLFVLSIFMKEIRCCYCLSRRKRLRGRDRGRRCSKRKSRRIVGVLVGSSGRFLFLLFLVFLFLLVVCTNFCWNFVKSSSESSNTEWRADCSKRGRKAGRLLYLSNASMYVSKLAGVAPPSSCNLARCPSSFSNTDVSLFFFCNFSWSRRRFILLEWPLISICRLPD